MLKILVIDENRTRTQELCTQLIHSGYQVAAVLSATDNLPNQVAAFKPDVILVDTDSPSRDILEHLAVMDQTAPRPVVLLGSDRSNDTIRHVVEAGVSTYVVDNLDPARLQPIIDIAVARFRHYQELRGKLAEAQRQLDERKMLDQAKTLLMKHRKLDEAAAYALLRKTAMSRGKTMGAIARELVESASLLL
ncbi:MAG: ANTAR domain-containing protein [Betaproteobacteria bacterium]|nr:ANTAR domain-containing protein [Betaproteobacteria bacterium]MDE2622463.1 ANTAR domain-containing protein [Betaproteobacteria bacterium]